MKKFGIIAAVLDAFSAVATVIAAWITHVILCIKSTSWILLIFGIIVPPIGLIHGFASWFGWL